MAESKEKTFVVALSEEDIEQIENGEEIITEDLLIKKFDTDEENIESDCKHCLQIRESQLNNIKNGNVVSYGFCNIGEQNVCLFVKKGGVHRR